MSREKDDGLLTLEHQKSNLGKKREPITLEWPDNGLPSLVGSGADISGLMAQVQGRADDKKAIELLKLIAEFESRGQYASPAPTARNNVFALLKPEPDFHALKLNVDSTKRLVTQCQRAKWLEAIDYKSEHTRKHCQRWTVTPDGRAVSGLPPVPESESAPTAPTAPTCM